jgi:hypothetical protein
MNQMILCCRCSIRAWPLPGLELRKPAAGSGQTLEQVLLPGNAILSTPHDPVAGPLTNVFISGTFKGKLNDWTMRG